MSDIKKLRYDFDCDIDRHGTCALKTDALAERFGRDDLEPLWIADMDFAVAPAITEALSRRYRHPIYGYASTPDSYWESIINWARRRHGLEIRREELTFIPGVVRGIAYALNYFTKPGDKVVIQPPVYHPFRMVIEGNGRKVVENQLVETADFKSYEMDLEGLERIMAEEKPAMMIVCNPHNPSGVQWSAETLGRVAELADRYGVKVVSDEIHGDLVLWGKRHIPMVDVSEAARRVTIMLAAPSKTFNIPGLVSSWMVVKDAALRDGFYKWLECNEFSDTMFTSTLAAETAYNECEDWLEQATGYIEQNLLLVEDYLAEHMPMIRAMRPDASFLSWLDCRALGLSQRELVELIVDDAHLALNDGTMFGHGGEGFMRLNVATPRHRLVKALCNLKAAVGKLERVDA